jgi:predicted nucleic acid-binding protein
MKNNVNETTILDAGVLIALALGEPSAAELSKKIINHRMSFACTEIALCELTYVLCRSLGWEEAQLKTENLVRSSLIIVIPSHALWNEAAKIKCKASIALPDCFTIAAARLANGTALFIRREKEIANALAQKQISDTIEFLV